MARFRTGELPTGYTCAICGASHVKLWKPLHCDEPLVCAKCAEEHQIPMKYQEMTAQTPFFIGEEVDSWISAPTGKNILMEKWIVNDDGEIPSHRGFPNHEGNWSLMTDQLFVDISKLFASCHYPKTILLPSIPDESKDVWGRSEITQDMLDWWKSLPTHK